MSGRKENDFLECTLDRWENGRAVLRMGDGQELAIARRFVPKNVAEGDVLELQLYTQEAATRKREELARAILKEILRG